MKALFSPPFRIVALFILTLSWAAVPGCRDSDIKAESKTEAVQNIPSKHGMVSSAHLLAGEAGLKVLREGGSAFDAAVAVAAVLNVVEPMMSGMGGYGTILVYDAEKRRVRFLDSSGKIPMGVNSDAFRDPWPDFESNRRGPMAVSTPGNVNAWEAMWKEYGKLKWEDLFLDAIRLAEEGFTISDGLAGMISRAFSTFPEHAKEFYGKSGSPVTAGDRLIQKDLARSFRSVAEGGAEAFYNGEIGRSIDKEMRRSGGFLRLDDLQRDRAEWWDPIHINYRGYEVYTAAPPSTAFPSLIRLGMMSLRDMRKQDSLGVDYLHYFAEVTKLAYADRLQYAGDPEINPPPMARLLSPSFWQEQADKIDPGRARPFEKPNVVVNSGDHTTHFVVADGWGNIVSATQTLGNAFGCRIMPEGTGIWLNNSLSYCTFIPKGNPMDAHAGHRKLSGDCPTIILKDGRPWAALGTPGGHTIGQTVPQMVIYLIDFEMNIQDALAAPRISFIEPDILAVEFGFSMEIMDGLRQKGHKVREAGGLGNAHGLRIVYDAGGAIQGFQGAADPRGSGRAVGY